MVRQDDTSVQKENLIQEDMVYGDGTISGSAPRPDSDDDVSEALEDVTGKPLVQKKKGFNIGDEANEAEAEIRDGEIDDYKKDVTLEDDDEENPEYEDDEEPNPYDALGEDDDMDVKDEE